MTVQVQGVLKTPFNFPASNIPIKVVTTVGVGDTLPSSQALYYTDAGGNYDFDLVYGTHEIFAMFDDAFELIGTSVVNEAVPTPSTISELLKFTTPIQPPIVDDIYDNVYGCIDCVEQAFDTCTTQLSDQVVQGDVGVCQAMTVYTNDRLQACSAELTTAMQAGDAQVLTQAQVYTDAAGTEIACCTTALETGLTEICSTLNTYTDANDNAVAELCTNMQAGDAQVLQQATAHSDACSGTVQSNLYNLVQACDAAAYVCMNAISCTVDTTCSVLEGCINNTCSNLEGQIGDLETCTNNCIDHVVGNLNSIWRQPEPPALAIPGDLWYDTDNNNYPQYMDEMCAWQDVQDQTVPALVTCTSGLTGDIAVLDCNIQDVCEEVVLQQAGYSIVTSAGDATASISLLATSFDNTDVACSEILMQADKIAFHNGDPTNTSYPFYMSGNQAFIQNAAIECLVGKDVCAARFYGGIVYGSVFSSCNFNSISNPAGGAPNGFCIDGATGNAEFANLNIHCTILSNACIQSGCMIGTNICGGIISGSAIQSSYITAGTPQLVMSWRNQELYGSMDLQYLCSIGVTPMFGLSVGVTRCVETTPANWMNLCTGTTMRPYNDGNTGLCNRYTRRYITPTVISNYCDKGGTPCVHIVMGDGSQLIYSFPLNNTGLCTFTRTDNWGRTVDVRACVQEESFTVCCGFCPCYPGSGCTVTLYFDVACVCHTWRCYDYDNLCKLRSFVCCKQGVYGGTAMCDTAKNDTTPTNAGPN